MLTFLLVTFLVPPLILAADYVQKTELSLKELIQKAGPDLCSLSLGASVPHILRLHILPNILGPLIVATTLSVADVILLESVLSFLGLGIQPPLASWGSMLSNAQELIATAPMLAVYPGMMIFLTVIACNLFGDALQRRWDPREFKS